MLLGDGNGELTELHLCEYTFPEDCMKTPTHQQFVFTSTK
jgi:aminoglycoside N3'-acetyltransferase